MMDSLANEEPLYVRYPVLSQWEFELQPHKQTVQGTVYCTDMVSQTITLLPVELPPLHLLTQQQQQQQQPSSSAGDAVTTEIRIVHVNGISKATPLASSETSNQQHNTTHSAESLAEWWNLPTAPLNKKTIEDRERKAIRQAEESFKHINEKVSPEGQEVFDRLLKACGEVVWKNGGDVISIVNSNIQVHPPYLPENTVGAAGPGLERVQMIVASVERTDNE